MRGLICSSRGKGDEGPRGGEAEEGIFKEQILKEESI